MGVRTVTGLAESIDTGFSIITKFRLHPCTPDLSFWDRWKKLSATKYSDVGIEQGSGGLSLVPGLLK